METSKKRGGARPGAGRPKGEPTKQMTFRLPLDIAEVVANQPNINQFVVDALRSYITAERKWNDS